MCRMYSVTREGYYAWKRRGPCARQLEDEALYDLILEVFQQSGSLYGSPKVTAALKLQGHKVSKKRVARIMQDHGLRARRACIYRQRPGLHHFIHSVPNGSLDVRADAPDRVWVGDITYLKLNDEWRYLAVVMDKYSRKILGWALGEQRTAKLTWQAFQRALASRRPKPGLLFHTDRGIEYRAHEFAARLARRGVVQSMNRPRRMNDNAFMESFFANFKAERIHRAAAFTCETVLKATIENYIEFYNNRRLHSSIGYTAPSQYEQQAA